MRFFMSIGFASILSIAAPFGVFAVGRARVEKQPFGKTADGLAVDAYTLTNKNGAKVKIITYGARVVSIEVARPRRKAG